MRAGEPALSRANALDSLATPSWRRPMARVFAPRANRPRPFVEAQPPFSRPFSRAPGKPGNHAAVRRLTIEASSLASARGFYAALTGFRVELELTPDDRYIVTVGIRNDADVVRVLQALERHAEARSRS